MLVRSGAYVELTMANVDGEEIAKTPIGRKLYNAMNGEVVGQRFAATPWLVSADGQLRPSEPTTSLVVSDREGRTSVVCDYVPAWILSGNRFQQISGLIRSTLAFCQHGHRAYLIGHHEHVAHEAEYFGFVRVRTLELLNASPMIRPFTHQHPVFQFQPHRAAAHLDRTDDYLQHGYAVLGGLIGGQGCLVPIRNSVQSVAKPGSLRRLLL